MSYDLDDLFVDEDLGEEGVWEEYYGGSELKIASLENPKYKATLAALAKKNRIKLDDSNEDAADLVADITAEALAKHVLKGWKGINLQGEKNVAYSWEKGKFAIRRSSKFREFVMDKAADASLFKKKVVEEVGKPSSGS
jgi:hypothetical protein